MAARGELGQRSDDSNGFFIKILTHRANDLYFTDITNFIYNKLHNDTSLNIVLGCRCRVFDVRLNVLHQSCFTTRKLGHLLNSTIDSVSF